MANDVKMTKIPADPGSNTPAPAAAGRMQTGREGSTFNAVFFRAFRPVGGGLRARRVIGRNFPPKKIVSGNRLPLVTCGD
jgi:hypothetical protein